MLRTTDGGAVYTYGHDGQNTEISFNRMSDNVCGGYGAAGIYLDGNSTSFVAHHNLIYNSTWALHYNPSSINIKWFNNTAVAFSYSLWGSSGGQAGSETNPASVGTVLTVADASPAKARSHRPRSTRIDRDLTNLVNFAYLVPTGGEG